MQAEQLALFGEDKPPTNKKIKVTDLERILRDREEPDLNLPKFVSYGGGKNSTALVILLCANNIKPDAILFADTGGEKPETYDYLDVMDEWLISVGFPKITRLKANSKHSSLEEECLASNTFPSKAYGYGKCSSKWKIQPQDKFRRHWKKERGIKGSKHIEYQGIHYGEQRRLINRRGELKEIENDNMRIEYPLITNKIDELGCLQLISAIGLPLPPKSACFFCPSSKPQEILQLKRDHPELYERAIAIENAGLTTAQKVKGLGRKFAWQDLETLTPLEKAAYDYEKSLRSCSCID